MSTTTKEDRPGEADELAEVEEARANAALRWGFLLIGIAGFAWAYLHIGDLLITQRNNSDEEILGADQKNNIKLAVQNRMEFHPESYSGILSSIYTITPHRTDGVVSPLWPWVTAWLTTNKHELSGPNEVSENDRILFDKGRRLALHGTTFFLVMIGLGLGLTGFSVPAIFNVLLLGGLGALLPRCAFFQPEPLYYCLLFLCWVCAVALVLRNDLPIYLAFGCLLGLTYLAKSSIQPVVAAFFAVTAYQCVRNLIEPIFTRKKNLEPRLWKARNHLVGLCLTIIGFLIFAGPKLYYSSKQFGSMFHSYPGYWMWMDNFEDAYDFMVKNGNAERLQSLDPEEKPSFSNYRKTHSNDEMWHRLSDGFWTKTSEFFAPEQTRRDKEPRRSWRGVLETRGHYLAYLLIGLTVLVLLMRFACRRPEDPDEAVSPEIGPAIIFVLGTFALTALAYGWYTPIGRGERFMLSLYLPLAFSLVAASDHLYRKARTRSAKPWFVGIFYLFQIGLTAVLCWRVYEILTWPHFTP